MLWLDSVFATPGIGIRLRPNYSEVLTFQSRVTTFLDFYKEKFGHLEVRPLDIWGYSLSSAKSAIFFEISPKNILAQVRYPLYSIPTPGQFPRLEIPKVSICTKLLSQLMEYLGKLLTTLQDFGRFSYDRIGIFVIVDFDKSSLLPRIEDWIRDLGNTLTGELVKSDTVLFTKLSEEETHTDQCHHTIRFDESKKEISYELILDWQRVFNTPPPLNHRRLLKDVETCKEEAIAYFDRFGQGDLYHEK